MASRGVKVLGCVHVEKRGAVWERWLLRRYARGSTTRPCANRHSAPRAGHRAAGPARAQRSAAARQRVAARARSTPANSAASCSCGTTSQGRNGVSAAAVTMCAAPLALAAQSKTCQHARKRPCKTRQCCRRSRAGQASGKPRRIAVGIQRKASDLRLEADQSHGPECYWSPRRRSPLSPPPIRVARPPARITPSGALMFRCLCGQICGVLRRLCWGQHRGSGGLHPQGKRTAVRASDRSTSGRLVAQSRRPTR